MKIYLLIKNVSRDFVPTTGLLQGLIKVIESSYHCPVEVVFETALSFRAFPYGKIVPVSPVEVTVSEDASDGKRTYTPRSFSAQADLINKKIQGLLLASGHGALNLPASVKIQSGGKKFKFLGITPVTEPEWR